MALQLMYKFRIDGGKVQQMNKRFLSNQYKNRTFDESEKSFFDKLHNEWWNDKAEEKQTWYDILNKIVGKNIHSLHDYNKHRFNFICKNYEFIFFEKLKERRESKEKGKEIKINILDVGCGGGILCEYMKRNFFYFLLKSDMINGEWSRGYSEHENKKTSMNTVEINIHGIDISKKLIEVANKRQEHEVEEIQKLYNKGEEGEYTGTYYNSEGAFFNAEKTKNILAEKLEERGGKINSRCNKIAWKRNNNWNVRINLRYQNCDIADLVNSSDEDRKKYDIIISSEVIEHVPNEKKEKYVKYISQLCNPMALVVFTSINKNIFSYIYTILLAEYITGIMKKGTHEYDKFIETEELNDLCSLFNIKNIITEYVIYIPFIRDYFLTRRMKLLFLSSFVYRGVEKGDTHSVGKIGRRASYIER
ncbi:3-demethylubiquinone-9 3-methyltransferase [Plasmodium gonderi]|uniref:3-demethylubiquinone-9 3-methyltransferase n=1 Tax=Plasmodium gonderi TaxID=77519 RepID=A0A1Y1JF67_PLAGO|nr:3-demethylubiquinone-9 3-methyltransferase [Plasmodium gonderi]GAW79382.1 3-demethylubiquinone-9 3-methyltransferase [Plasmodium gonderi]